MKRLVALMLSMIFIFSLTACSRDNDTAMSNTQSSEIAEDNSVGEDGGWTVSAADYYAYLNDNYVSEVGLAPEEEIKIILEKGNFDSSLARNVETGIVSADVRDFDGDGELEMLMLRFSNLMRLDTFFRTYCYDDPDNLEITGDVPEQRALVLQAFYLDTEDGAVVEKDYNDVSIMLLSGWGYLYAGLEKIGDNYYLFASTASENPSTYGPSYMTVMQVGGESRPLLRRYISAISEIGMNQSQADEMYDLSSSIDISRLSLSDHVIPYDPSAETCKDALGNQLLCFADIDYPEWNGDDVYETITDFTNLRYYLENGADDWQVVELPEGYEKEVPVIPEGLTSLIAELDSAAGTGFSDDEIMLTENGNGSVYTAVEYDTLTLSITWDIGANQINSICLSTDNYLDDKWYAVKDELLKLSVFGFTENEIAPLLGKVSLTDYMNGIVVGDYTCNIASVADTFIRIWRN